MVFQAQCFPATRSNIVASWKTDFLTEFKTKNIIKKPQLFEKRSLETSSLELQRHYKVHGGEDCCYHCKAILDCSGAHYSSVLFLLQEWAIWGETF